MKNNIPKTPLSTGLSGDAKEIKLRLYNIMQHGKKKTPAILVCLTAALVLFCCGLVSCQAEEPPAKMPEPSAPVQTPRPTPNGTEQEEETNGITLLNQVFDTLAEVTVTLEQGDRQESYETALDEYWAARMPTGADFNWRETGREEGRAGMSSKPEDDEYRMILSSDTDDTSWSLTVQSGSNYAVLTRGDQEYYFAGAEEYAHDSEWTAALALRAFYDAVEYESLGGAYSSDLSVFVPNEGQDYLMAALTGYQRKEEAHLKVSSGSKFCFSFVRCSVTPAEEETEHFRNEGIIDENTWAVRAETVFVPENEFAYNEAMTKNTAEYSGDGADVPAGALVYSCVGYVTLTADGWRVSIGAAGW